MSFTRVTLSWCIGQDGTYDFHLLEANGKRVRCPVPEHRHKLEPRKSWLCDDTDCGMAYVQKEPPAEHEHAVW